MNKIKVLVVDDSALMRKMIPMLISADNDIEVVGTAMDGDFAINKIPQLTPDVITLDIDMPRMDGITTLKSIVKDFGIPVILVSSLTKEGAEITLKGLEMGAIDFVPKPDDAISVHISEISSELIGKIKAASSGSRPKYRELQPGKTKSISSHSNHQKFFSAERVIAIGVSTGGPQALTEILPNLPSSFPAGIVIVQHMPEGFTELFASRLDSICSVNVREAADGDVVSPGTVLIAPGNRHIKVRRTHYGTAAVLSQSPPVSGHRPSATVLFNSIAEEYRENAIGIIMTGMGDDGVEGLGNIKENGGLTIAQNEETSVIYGMPKVALERGYADMVLGLNEIVPRLMKIMIRDVKHGTRYMMHDTGQTKIYHCKINN
jgi:two-component system chemotaxis response regulator CheB